MINITFSREGIGNDINAFKNEKQITAGQENDCAATDNLLCYPYSNKYYMIIALVNALNNSKQQPLVMTVKQFNGFILIAI